MKPNTVLWIYIVLLVMGGMMGFIKGKSKISLITSVIAAAILSLCAVGAVFQPVVADVVLAVLLIFFAWRFIEKRKFMPGGLMLAMTLAALVLRHLHF